MYKKNIEKNNKKNTKKTVQKELCTKKLAHNFDSYFPAYFAVSSGIYDMTSLMINTINMRLLLPRWLKRAQGIIFFKLKCPHCY